MRRIGLALSGGGFRATLFHLGMIRFLREAGILTDVSHITSVSGGSILAAHLVLHWDRYTGSLKDFDDAAAEIIRFVKMDIRNRVVRRYPLALPVRALRALTLQRSNRQLTRTGLLEHHYEQFLFGDTCLFQLPERPRLFLLATNLSEGCLCAFTRDGLLMQRRAAGGFRFERIHTGLATIPMAVTASSAFPGFFPPIELQGLDVGADPGRFGRLAFTDGGVYDNLGVRMFRCLERSWMAREIALQVDDLVDAPALQRTLEAAGQSADDTPLRRLTQMMTLPRERSGLASGEPVDRMLAELWDVMSHENLAREPSFAPLMPADPEAHLLMTAARAPDADIEPGEQLWLNRQLVDAAVKAATGQSCFRSLSAYCDTVLVSDAGKQFKIVNNARAGGLITTAMRASDILMDRVWQLEVDTFNGTPGFVFAPISKVIGPDEDPTASHPEIQRMTAEIRTDLDRFSDLETRHLIRHGYCVGRSACRSRPDLFGSSLPAEPPWDPFGAIEPAAKPASPSASPGAALAPPNPETAQARSLQTSAQRRLWSTLFDFRDWASYVYLPLLAAVLIVLPYYIAKWRHQSHVSQRLIEGLAQSNRDYSVMSKLLLEGPFPAFKGMPAKEVREVPKVDYAGLEIINDTRVLDFRLPETGENGAGPLYLHRRLRVQKIDPRVERFSARFRMPATRVEFRALNRRVPATLLLCRNIDSVGDNNIDLYELTFDLSRVPVKETVELSMDALIHDAPAEFLSSVPFQVDADTAVFGGWILLPEGKEHEMFEILRRPTGKPGPPEIIMPSGFLKSANNQILAFNLLNLSPEFTYEVRWTYRE